MTDDYIGKAKHMEKIGSSEEQRDRALAILSGASKEAPDLSGVTQTQLVLEASSLLDESAGGTRQNPPNFVTECFFMVHILISFQGKKLEQFYQRNNDEVNKAIDAKDWQMFDE